jgi:hypothetical protein
MRTCVITPCGASKRGDVPDPARAADLADPERRQRAEARLAAFACPAIEMYTGTHHRLVMDGVHAVWERWGRQALDVAILSGGYGLLRAEEEIIPYDVSLDEFEGAELYEWAARLRIPERTAQAAREYDLVFYLLDGRYLSVLHLPLDVPASVQQIVLTTAEDVEILPQAASLHAVVAAGGVAARRWHVKAPHVRGFLFERLCRQVVQHGSVVLEWLCNHPEDTEQLFYKRARWRPQLAFW